MIRHITWADIIGTLWDALVEKVNRLFTKLDTVREDWVRRRYANRENA
jgi:hypothetical protein